MKKQILHLGMIAACAASSSAQAQISDQETPPAYNLAVHQAVVALLNAQVIAAEKAYNATVHNDPVFTSSHYDTESMIAQSLEWPTADLAETWLSQNSNLTIPQAVSDALFTQIRIRISQLEKDNSYGVIPFPDDNAIPIVIPGLPRPATQLPPYAYTTGPDGAWEPVPMATEEFNLFELSPKGAK